MSHKVAIAVNGIDLISPNQPAAPWNGMRWKESKSFSDSRNRFHGIGNYWEWDASGNRWSSDKLDEFEQRSQALTGNDFIYFPLTIEDHNLIFTGLEWHWNNQATWNSTNNYSISFGYRDFDDNFVTLATENNWYQAGLVAGKNYVRSYSYTHFLDRSALSVQSGYFRTAKVGTTGAITYSVRLLYRYTKRPGI